MTTETIIALICVGFTCGVVGLFIGFLMGKIDKKIIVMAQYIDKAALVAEINKRIIDAPVNNIGHQRVWAYNDVKDIIDTLERKEVDLYEELDVYFAQFKGLEKSYWNWRIDSINIHAQGIYDFAKHFFELGLKAQKGE